MYNDVWNALEQATLFAGMKAEEIEGELKALDFNVRDIPAKDTFLYQGKACQEAIIVLDGELVARMTEGDNKTLTVDYLRTGTLLTPAFLFSNDRNGSQSCKAFLYVCCPSRPFVTCQHAGAPQLSSPAVRHQPFSS